MPIVNPHYVLRNELRGISKNPAFANLSPASQAAIQKEAARGDLAAPDFDPAFKAAIVEAQQQGLLNNTPLWKELLKDTGLALGGAVTAGALGSIGGGGAGGLSSMAPGAEGGVATAASALPAAVTAGGVPAAVTAGVTTAVKGSSLLHDLLPSIIGGGATVGGAAIAAHANTEAAKIAAEQADKALAIQQQQYALQRQDTAPYRALGQGAVGNLGFLSGINMPQENIDALSSTVPKTTPPPIPTASTPPTYNSPQSLATLGAPQQPQAPANNGGLVPMKNPDTGLVHLIPPDQVAAATQSGGVRV